MAVQLDGLSHSTVRCASLTLARNVLEYSAEWDSFDEDVDNSCERSRRDDGEGVRTFGKLAVVLAAPHESIGWNLLWH